MSSSVRRELEGFVAGRVKAERFVIAVAAAYYGERGNGKGERLRPLIEVIDRASPGIVELGIVPGGAGFEIRLAERPFPKEHEAQLRQTAEAVLSGCKMRDAGCVKATEATHPVSRITHLVSWIRSLFRRPSS